MQRFLVLRRYIFWVFFLIFFIFIQNEAHAVSGAGSCKCERDGNKIGCLVSDSENKCNEGYVPRCPAGLIGMMSCDGCNCVIPTPTPGAGAGSCSCEWGGNETGCFVSDGKDKCNDGYIARCPAGVVGMAACKGCTCVIPTPTPPKRGTCSCVRVNSNTCLVNLDKNNCESGYKARCPVGIFSSCENECLCIEPTSTPPPLPKKGTCSCVRNGLSCGITEEGNNCEQGYAPKCPSGLASCANDCQCFPEPTPIPGGSYNGDPICDRQSIDNPEIKTAVGCIPVRYDKFIAKILPWLFGIIGGIAFLLMVYGFILLALSAGDPAKVQAAKGTITSAFIGVLFVIFSLFIAQMIMVNILHIPGVI